MSISQPERVLIIKLRHHGDVLLSTPVADALKHKFPDCEIDMLVYAPTADVIRDNRQIANIFTIDRGWKKQGLRAQLAHEKALFKNLKARHYDWAFNISDQWRAAFLAKFCARYSAGIACRKRDNFLWRHCHDFLNEELDTTHHMVESNLNVLPPLVLPEEYPAKVRMEIDPANRESVLEKLSAQGWNGEPYVLAHPGARWFFKCWEDGKNAALLQLLLLNGKNIVLTASPDAAEQEMVQSILGRLKIPDGVHVWVLSGCLNLRELAAAIDGAELFFGVDSVPMHIAAALDKPQVALFGPSWVGRWRPYSDKAELVWAGDFAELPHPDSIDTDDATRLLGAIPLDVVWEKVRAKLGV